MTHSIFISETSGVLIISLVLVCSPNQRIQGGTHSENAIKPANGTTLLKYLTNKIGSLMIMKFEESSSSRDNLFQKDFNHRKGSRLAATEGFSPM